MKGGFAMKKTSELVNEIVEMGFTAEEAYAVIDPSFANLFDEGYPRVKIRESVTEEEYEDIILEFRRRMERI